MENYYFEPMPEDEWSPSDKQKLLAWSVHLATASSAVWGLMSLIAITNEQWVLAFAWMGVAVFIDSFDGLLARRVRVKAVLPGFDGALLDNIVDFLTYVFVPAFFLYYKSDLLPAQVTLVGPALILLASSFQFCQVDAKTEDHYFKGFPSYWNFLVYYMFILNLNDWLNFAILVLLSILVFVPIKYIYPSRTEEHQWLTMGWAGLWGIANVMILVEYPDQSRWWVLASLSYVVYYCGLTIYSMLEDRGYFRQVD